MEKKSEIPKEIDDHFKLFGKEPWEVEYGEKCPVCKKYWHVDYILIPFGQFAHRDTTHQ